MTRYYCKKCGVDSPGDICPSCGKKLPANTLRNVWRVYHTPAADFNCYRSAFAALGTAVGLAELTLLILSFVDTSSGGPAAFITSGAFLSALAILPAGLILTAVFLALQGREILDYSLDGRGAHLRALQASGRIRSYSRLQTAPVGTLEDQGTGMRAVSQIRHIRWADVSQLIFRPERGEILLFSSSRLAPFILRLPPEEYDDAERFVKKYCKKILK